MQHKVWKVQDVRQTPGSIITQGQLAADKKKSSPLEQKIPDYK